MSKICQVCQKGIMRGKNVSHAKNRTNRICKPNLKTRKIEIDGQLKKVIICTKCIKKINNQKKVKPDKTKKDI